MLHLLFQSSYHLLFQVAAGACQVFGLITHFFYLAFFAWTGCRILRILKTYIQIFTPGLEAYFFYRALVTVFDTNRLSAILHYTVCVRVSKLFYQFDVNIFLQRGLDIIFKVGYAAPFVIVMTTLTVGIATADEAYILVQDGEVSQQLNISCNVIDQIL